MKKPRKKIHRLESRHLTLPGCKLCVAFTNSALGRPEAGRRAHLGVVAKPLESYLDFVQWLVAADGLSSEDAQRLVRLAQEDPERADAVFEQALAFRDEMTGLCESLLQGRKPALEDMERINADVRRFQPRLQIAARDGAFTWTWEREATLEPVMWLLTSAAAELFTQGAYRFLRRCSGKRCSVLYLNYEPRRQDRRWCCMAVCGNVDKSRRYYEEKSARLRRRAIRSPEPV